MMVDAIDHAASTDLIYEINDRYTPATGALPSLA